MAIVINGQTGIDAGHLPISNAGNTEVEGTLTGADVTVASITANNVITQGQNVSPFSGFKNYIINGNFSVNMYGKLPYVAQSVAAVIIDGNWACANSGTGTLTLSEDTITYENTVYAAIKATATTAITLGADTRYFSFYQTLEANNISEVSNKDMALSFLFECSRAGKYSVALIKKNPATNVVQKSYLTSFNATIGVQQVVIPIPAESYQVLRGVNSGMYIQIGFVTNNAAFISSSEGWQDETKLMKSDALQWGNTAGAYIKYAQVQLEEGSVATPFENRPYGLELSLCQRYFEVIFVKQWAYVSSASQNVGVSLPYKQEKRVKPSIVFSGFVYSNCGNITNESLSSSSLTAYVTSTSDGALSYQGAITASAALL